MEKEYAIGIDLGGSYRRKPMYQQKLSSDSWLLLSMK